MARNGVLRIPALVVAAALVVLVTAAVASAQTTATSFEDTTIQVQVWPEIDAQNTLVIVGATLPTDTPLPATVELPLPLGAQVQWVGEIEGTNPDLDVQRTHEIVPGQGGSSVRFTIETFRSFQYEAFLPASAPEGAERSLTLDWIQTVASRDLSVAWKFPAGASNVVLDPDAPGQPATNAAGESLYTLVSVAPQPGETLTFSASYLPAGAVEESGSGVSTVTIVIGLLLVAVVALIIVLARQKRQLESEE